MEADISNIHYSTLKGILESEGDAGLKSKLDADLLKDGAGSLISTMTQIIRESIEIESRVNRLETQMLALDVPVVNSTIKKEMFTEKVSISATMAFRANQGLRKLEYTESGQHFRWTGANEEECTFLIPIDRSKPRNLTIDFLEAGPLADGRPFELIGFLDGVQTKFKLRRKNGFCHFSTKILKWADQKNVTFLSLKIPTWIPSQEDSKSSDQRTLGLAFVSLSAA